MATRRMACAVQILVTLASCTPGGGVEVSPAPGPRPVLRVAFFQDGTVEAPLQHVAPAFQGIRLAFLEAEEEGFPVDLHLDPVETEGDPGTALEEAARIADDPGYVAAVIAPGWVPPGALGDALSAAGIPTVSLSSAVGDPEGWDGWFRPVANGSLVAAALAQAASDAAAGTPCVATDGRAASRALADAVTRWLPGEAEVLEIAAGDGADAVVGCPAVAWTGGGESAASLRAGLDGLGMTDVPLVGGDAMRDLAYLDLAGDAADGTIAVCACVDLSASTDIAAQRFIHDYQLEFGAPPRNLSAEAYDLGRVLVGALAAGATTRREVARALGSPFDGLAGSYGFGATGELDAGLASVVVSRASQGRWIPVSTYGAEAGIPTHAPRVLAAVVCRRGAPFALLSGRGAPGFHAELIGEIARSLGLRASIALGCGTTRSADLVVGGSRPGWVSSRVAFSLRLAAVWRREDLRGGGEPLGGLGRRDVVAAVRGTLARAFLRTTGSRVRTLPRAEAYRALETGSVSAVVDQEPAAWAAIEDRPRLRVGGSIDVGDDDVLAGPSPVIVAWADAALAELLADGRYALLFAKYFPGARLPPEVGALQGRAPFARAIPQG